MVVLESTSAIISGGNGRSPGTASSCVEEWTGPGAGLTQEHLPTHKTCNIF